MKLRLLRVRLSRALGGLVCRVRCQHLYSFELIGCYKGWCAYSCIRCGELDRPLDDLPPAPDDDDRNYYDDTYAELAVRQGRRWISWLPWPKWL